MTGDPFDEPALQEHPQDGVVVDVSGNTGGRLVGRRTGLAIAVSVVLANISNYSFQIIAGRQLSVEDYGLLGGFMAVITVIAVSSSALQTTAARVIAAGEASPPSRRVDGLTRSALAVSAALFVVTALASPLISNALRVGTFPVLLLGAFVAASAVSSIAAGRLQGQRRFAGLAAYSTVQAVSKLALSTAVLLAGANVAGLIGAIVGSVAAVGVIGMMSTASAGAVETHVLGADSRRAFIAITLFWIILSIDVPLARATFTEADAGIYTAGVVLGKAVLWLPTMVAQLVFPSLADPNATPARSRALMRRATMTVLALAVVSVLALFVLGDPLYRFLYDDRYAPAADIAWLVGLAVVPLAFVHLLMFQLLARRDGRFVRWFIVIAIVEVIALQSVPPTGTWYAAVLGGVGLVLLVPVWLVYRFPLVHVEPHGRGV